jgi:hypothetical protein
MLTNLTEAGRNSEVVPDNNIEGPIFFLDVRFWIRILCPSTAAQAA